MNAATRRFLVGGLVVLWLSAGCGAADSVRPGANASRVAADPDATAAEIIDAGQLGDVVADDGGRTLRFYSVDRGDDEGPRATAWEVRDANGAVLTQQVYARAEDAVSSPGLVRSLPEGFIFGSTGGFEGSGGNPRPDAGGGARNGDEGTSLLRLDDHGRGRRTAQRGRVRPSVVLPAR